MTTTKNITRKELLASTNIPASLVNAVIRQFGGWSSFKQSALDVCRGGIDGGFHGFIYTAETNAFAKRHHKLIAQMASQQADEMGCEVFEMIKGFGCFRNGQKPNDEEIGMALYAGKNVESGFADMLNALAWYAGEEVCREYQRMTEE